MVTDEKIAELTKLHRLHREGALSEDEFKTLKRGIIEGDDSNVPLEIVKEERKERLDSKSTQISVASSKAARIQGVQAKSRTPRNIAIIVGVVLLIILCTKLCGPSEASIRACLCQARSPITIIKYNWNFKAAVKGHCYPKFGKEAVDKVWWHSTWMPSSCP